MEEGTRDASAPSAARPERATFGIGQFGERLVTA